ncbi:MAG: hypothetical protein O3C21_02810 [Verrucomicrobia bacterium]|nr:hypothetical protein [Verrucomicrobiota bacterium]
MSLELDAGLHVLRWEFERKDGNSFGSWSELSDFEVIGDFATWASAIGLAGAKETSDPDFDGLENVVEYALGTDPLSREADGLTMVETESGVWVTYPFAPDRQTGVDTALEVSTDLAQWLPMETVEYPDDHRRALIENPPAQLWVRLAISAEEQGNPGQ